MYLYSYTCYSKTNCSFLYLYYLPTPLSSPTDDIVRRLAIKKWKVTSVLQFAKLDLEARKEFYAAESFSLQQITDIEQVLKQLPHDVEMKITTEVT